MKYKVWLTRDREYMVWLTRDREYMARTCQCDGFDCPGNYRLWRGRPECPGNHWQSPGELIESRQIYDPKEEFSLKRHMKGGPKSIKCFEVTVKEVKVMREPRSEGKNGTLPPNTLAERSRDVAPREREVNKMTDHFDKIADLEDFKRAMQKYSDIVHCLDHGECFCLIAENGGHEAVSVKDLIFGLAMLHLQEKQEKQHLKAMSNYEPEGTRFYDKGTGRDMILVTEGHSKDWLCYRHPDGQWVTLRKATIEDLKSLENAK